MKSYYKESLSLSVFLSASLPHALLQLSAIPPEALPKADPGTMLLNFQNCELNKLFANCSASGILSLQHQNKSK